MVCHVCGKGAIGQCQHCWKFYCADHGDRICSVCQQKADDNRLNGARLMAEIGKVAVKHPRGFLRSLLPGSNIVLGSTSEPTEAELAEWKKWQMDGLEMKRVVPIAQSAEWGERHLTLISLVIYEDGSHLTFQTVGPAEPLLASADFDMPAYYKTHDPVLRVEDDLRTEYFVRGGGGGGGHVWHGHKQVTPRIPDLASRLLIYVRLPLASGVAPQTAGPELRFDVAL
jgi:hypothetical protein